MREFKKLNGIAQNIRELSLKMIYNAGTGHPGGTLSCADIIAYLYFKELNLYPSMPDCLGRDRFVLSKGHACPALYAALGLKGYFSTEEFKGFRQIGGMLQGHPDADIPGIEAASGSLGMGLSQGLGMALGLQRLGTPSRVYVLLGDGDMEEGSTWEAIMAAGYYKLNNMVAILDANKFQGDNSVLNQMDYHPVEDKILAFRWNIKEIDGHDFSQMKEAFEEAKSIKDKPCFILAHTIKGKGVSFMEGNNAWHGSRSPSERELSQAILELRKGVD